MACSMVHVPINVAKLDHWSNYRYIACFMQHVTRHSIVICKKLCCMQQVSATKLLCVQWALMLHTFLLTVICYIIIVYTTLSIGSPIENSYIHTEPNFARGT